MTIPEVNNREKKLKCLSTYNNILDKFHMMLPYNLPSPQQPNTLGNVTQALRLGWILWNNLRNGKRM